MGETVDNKITPASGPEASIRDGSTDGHDDSGVKGDVYGDEVHVVDKAAERRLTRKLDFRLMPVLAIMCEPRTASSPITAV